MTPMEKLTEWHANWRITQVTISCKTCHAEQLEADQEHVFIHAPGCVKAKLGIQPWPALNDVQKAFSSGGKHE